MQWYTHNYCMLQLYIHFIWPRNPALNCRMSMLQIVDSHNVLSTKPCLICAMSILQNANHCAQWPFYKVPNCTMFIIHCDKKSRRFPCKECRGEHVLIALNSPRLKIRAIARFSTEPRTITSYSWEYFQV